MAEKPGEFSNWYNSRIVENIGVDLYRTATEIVKILQRAPGHRAL